jgi:hypothetical protein
MMMGTDYVVTQPFFSSNGASGIIDFLPGDHLFVLGQSHDPGWWRALLSRGGLRKTIFFFERSDLATFVRVSRHV